MIKWWRAHKAKRIFKKVATRTRRYSYTDSSRSGTIFFDMYENGYGKRKCESVSEGQTGMYEYDSAYLRVVKPWLEKSDEFPRYWRKDKLIENTIGYDATVFPTGDHDHSEPEPDPDPKDKIVKEEDNVVEVDFRG